MANANNHSTHLVFVQLRPDPGLPHLDGAEARHGRLGVVPQIPNVLLERLDLVLLMAIWGAISGIGWW